MTEYHIVLESPLGERQGLLSLQQQNNDAVSGIITLLGCRNPISGTRQGMEYRLRHSLRTLLNTLECETTLQAVQDTITGTVQVGPVRMPLHGQIIQKEGDSHGTAK